MRNGRWLGLCGALVVTLSLTSCAAGTGARSMRTGDSAAAPYRTSAGAKWEYLPNSRYYADGDGTVKRYRQTQTGQWEQLGKALEEGWNQLMKGAEDTVKDTGQAARDLGREVKKDAAEAETGMKS